MALAACPPVSLQAGCRLKVEHRLLIISRLLRSREIPGSSLEPQAAIARADKPPVAPYAVNPFEEVIVSIEFASLKL